MRAIPPHQVPQPYVPLAGLLIAAAAATALGLALLGQHGFGLQPCVLCIWQRWPHLAAVAFGLAAWALHRRPGASAALLGLAAAAELTTSGIGVFHVGVEQGWWQGTAECGSTAGGSDLATLRSQIMNQPIVRCDEVAFAVLGISMAGWNAILAAGLAVVGLGAVARDLQRARESRA